VQCRDELATSAESRRCHGYSTTTDGRRSGVRARERHSQALSSPIVKVPRAALSPPSRRRVTPPSPRRRRRRHGSSTEGRRPADGPRADPRRRPSAPKSAQKGTTTDGPHRWT
jgi:hypothetical protein